MNMKSKDLIFPSMVKKPMCKVIFEMIEMMRMRDMKNMKNMKDNKDISKYARESFSIYEFYRCGIEGSELLCHRLDISRGTAGELIMKMQKNQKVMGIEEVFIEREFRNTGLGSKLLVFAERTACALGFQSVELRPFSTDPLVSDPDLKDWYMKRGYQSYGKKMRKRIYDENPGVMT